MLLYKNLSNVFLPVHTFDFRIYLYMWQRCYRSLVRRGSPGAPKSMGKAYFRLLAPSPYISSALTSHGVHPKSEMKAKAPKRSPSG